MYQDVDPDTGIAQGDVFAGLQFAATASTVNAVVVNPSCDFAHDKAHFVKFISVVSVEVALKIIADSLGIDVSIYPPTEVFNKKRGEALLKALAHNTTGDFLPRYYYMSALDSRLASAYLDFQKVFVMPTLQVENEFMTQRIANVTSPWREQILARYGAYSTRVGTPDYTEQEMRDLLVKSGFRLGM